MVALLVILSCVAVLAGAFVIVIRQMAEAHRRQYRDEVAANKFACAREHAREQKAARKARPARIAAKPRKRIHRTPADHPHSASMM